MFKAIQLSIFLLIFSTNVMAEAFNFHTGTGAPIPKEEAFTVSNDFSKGKTERIIVDIENGYYLYKDRIKLHNTVEFQTLENIPYVTENDPFYGEIEAVKNSFSIQLNNTENYFLVIQGCNPEHSICYEPQYFKITYDHYEGDFNIINSNIDEFEKNAPNENNDNNTIEGSQNKSLIEKAQDSSFIVKVVIFFIIGVGISLTPCVLPMIPIISSMIVSSTKSKPQSIAMGYVIGSAFLYGLIGLITTLGFFGIQGYIQNTWFIVLSVLILVSFSFIMIDKINLYKIKGISNVNSFVQNKTYNINFNFKNSFGIGFLSSMMLSPCVAAPLGALLLYTTTLGNPFISFIYLFSFGMGAGLILILASNGLKRINPQKFIFTKYVISATMLFISVFLLSRIVHNDLIIFTLYSFSAFYILYLYSEDFNKAKLRLFTMPIFALSIIVYSYYFYDNKEIGNGIENTYIETVESIPENGDFIIKVYAEWCIYCQDMDQSIFNKEIKGYDIYTVDITSINSGEREILLKYNAISAPAIIIFENGIHKKTHNGHLNKTDFEKLLYN